MNEQDVIDWLNQVKMLDELIDAKIAERDQLWTLATKITPEMSDMPRGGGGVSDKVGNAAVKLAEMAVELNDMIDRYVDHKNRVVSILETLPHKQYGTLHRYYIQYMTWEEVAADMNKSTVQIWRYWQDGIKNLGNVIECNVLPVI